ncbi:MAG: hypothetical protein ACE5IR_03810 [bacterium]
MRHQDAIRIITQMLMEPNFPAQRLNSAKLHIASCKSCMQELDLFISLITGKSSKFINKINDLFVAECQEYLKMDDVVSQADRVKFKSHVQSCKVCASFSNLLDDIQKEDAKGAFGAFSTAPPFGEYYQKIASQKIWQKMAEGVQQLNFNVHVAFSKGKAFFTDLPEAPELIPQFLPALAYRGKSKNLVPDAKKHISSLQIVDKKRQVTINITFLEATFFKISFQDKSTQQPKSKVKMDIRDPDTNKLWVSKSAEVGKQVLFEHTTAMKKGLLLKVSYKKLNWHIPINCLYP